MYAQSTEKDDAGKDMYFQLHAPHAFAGIKKCSPEFLELNRKRLHKCLAYYYDAVLLLDLFIQCHFHAIIIILAFLHGFHLFAS